MSKIVEVQSLNRAADVLQSLGIGIEAAGGNASLDTARIIAQSGLKEAIGELIMSRLFKEGQPFTRKVARNVNCKELLDAFGWGRDESSYGGSRSAHEYWVVEQSGDALYYGNEYRCRTLTTTRDMHGTELVQFLIGRRSQKERCPTRVAVEIFCEAWHMIPKKKSFLSIGSLINGDLGVSFNLEKKTWALAPLSRVSVLKGTHILGLC